jgi:DNA processing protein
MVLDAHANLAYYLALTQAPRLSSRCCLSILSNYGIADLFNSDFPWPQLNLDQQTLTYLTRPPWQSIEDICRWHCPSKQQYILCWEDNLYPALLREIASPPLILYVKGQPKLLSTPQLAMVGTRKPTPSGKDIAYSLAQQASQVGLTITSGLALGIDAACHRGALAANGLTVAVLGAGIECIYPTSHRTLAEQITAQGALLSEFPLHAPARAWQFPQRNRIMSGLCYGTLVIEAALKSGSLISARYALEQGRDVFAVPGSIYNTQAQGCHWLLRQGAILVESVQDIIDEFAPRLSLTPKSNSHTISTAILATPLSAIQAQLIACVGFELTSIDKIIARSCLPTQIVCANLPSLVLSGHIEIVAGGYARKRVERTT